MAIKEWKDLTRNDLVRMIGKMSGLEIGKTYGVHHNTVYARLTTLGIETNGKKRRFDPPKEELAALYAQMSMAKIAEHYGVGETVVFKRLKQHGIGGITRADRMVGKPKSMAHRIKLSESALSSGIRSGAKNGNWKGGVSSGNKRARSKAAYSEWKAEVLKAANWKCTKCGVEHGHVCPCCGSRTLLHAHHIKPFFQNVMLRYDPNNGIALCTRCHKAEHHN